MLFPPPTVLAGNTSFYHCTYGVTQMDHASVLTMKMALFRCLSSAVSVDILHDMYVVNMFQMFIWLSFSS